MNCTPDVRQDFTVFKAYFNDTLIAERKPATARSALRPPRRDANGTRACEAQGRLKAGGRDLISERRAKIPQFTVHFNPRECGTLRSSIYAVHGTVDWCGLRGVRDSGRARVACARFDYLFETTPAAGLGFYGIVNTAVYGF